MLIDISSDTPPPADLWGIVIALNDLFERRPALFGSPKARQSLKKDIQDYLDLHGKLASGTPNFFIFLDERLSAHHIPPFKDVSLAFVGGYSAFTGASTLTSALPVLRRFAPFYDINAHDCGSYLRLDNVRQLAPQKVDYVITGNVLNDIGNLHSNDDTILTCGTMLKAGGRAIHMLEFGEDEHSGRIEDAALQAYAGQQHLYNIPPGPYVHDTLLQNRTKVMVLEQQREVTHEPVSADAFYLYQRAEECGHRWEQHGAQSRLCITDAKKQPLFTSQEFHTFLLNHPDQITQMRGLEDWTKLNLDITTISTSDAAKQLVDSLPLLPFERSCLSRRLDRNEIESIKNTFVQFRDGAAKEIAKKISHTEEIGSAPSFTIHTGKDMLVAGKKLLSEKVGLNGVKEIGK